MRSRFALAFGLAAAVAVGYPTASAETARSSGLDLASYDRSQRPQDDLFRFVNGGWLAANPIPADRSRWGTVDQLIDNADAQVRALLESPPDAGDAEAAAIRAYYASFMDEARVEALGVRPLAGEMERIARLADPRDLARHVGESRARGVSSPIGMYIGIDRGDPNAYVPHLGQGGLGMPDRDYYLESGQFGEVQARYRAYLERLFSLAGLDEPATRAARVYGLEHALAEAQWSRVENRDPVRTYNRMTARDAAGLAPGVEWAALLAGAGLPAGGHFVLSQPGYATALGKLMAEQPIEAWRDYFTARLLDSYAAYLSREFVEADFDFSSRTLRGTPENRPRWKRAVAEVNRGMGFAVGREYVARHFPLEAKSRMDALVHNLLAAMEVGIGELDWMSEATRAEARTKLSKVRVKIGYPDRWRDYLGLEIRADDLVGNVMRATAFDWRRQAARLGGPVDRDEWLMTPQTVNAYYMPTGNEIVFPAAILQPPFFSVDAEDAVNYGAIGSVIGHEISHGFDDSGRRYDGDGRLRDWWTAEDDAAYRARTERLVAQYDGYRPLPDAGINGRLSLGENIGDLSGLAIAWRAWQLSLEGREPPVLDGYTGAQRFFLGFGQIWRANQREAALRQQLVTGPHAPGEYRANGVLSNFEPFYEAFGLKDGDGLWRPEAERVKIW
jgi:predicted metalloendopeptidase